MPSGLPVLDIHATQLKTGQKVRYFENYVEVRYKNIPDQLSRGIMIRVDGERITENNKHECFYKVDGNSVTVYTRHFSLIIPECGIPCHVYHSPLIVNIYKKEIAYGFKFKIYLTTVSNFLSQ